MNLTPLLQQIRAASRTLGLLAEHDVNAVLLTLADEAVRQSDFILAENAKDLARMDRDSPLYDRLLLSPERIAGIAEDIRGVAALPSPVGRTLAQATRPNGMSITKRSVPFGVVGVVYEARPNVTFDVFSLCFKSGNACALKGGSDAQRSNEAIISVVHAALRRHGVDEMAAQLLPASREATAALLNATGLVDLVIPRGSASLISFVRHASHIPVIETGTGVCHVYVDEAADADVAQRIVANAKTRRVSVCNAAECLLVSEKRLADLPAICSPLAAAGVILFADEPALAALRGCYPAALLERAAPEHYGCEFQDYKMAVKTVGGVGEAVDFINTHGTMHSECIVSASKENVAFFQQRVDAACVYANVSTAFTDGAQFGLGAEVGISTQKLHARGPMGLAELCTYKWIVEGNGQVRP
ncbi:MAG: glutamate-5-semialdehyde dehydrogenase [Prevotellaceae bacterium]|jgi:glutamate-5-semialdehyde dehydrogenase|nr:glutamate-5-semialdehyde dehydrogenase [Prevotellaceae bacterium]